MFDSIRKHQSWLWILIGGVVIISFVWYFLPNTSRGRARSRELGRINGRAITQRDINQALGQIQFEAAMRGMRAQNPTYREIYQYIFLKGKIEEMGIQPSVKAMKDFAQNQVQSMQQMGLRNYDDLVNRYLPAFGYSASDFNEYARRMTAIQELSSLVSSAGKLVPPQEAEVRFRRDHEQVTGEFVLFSATNYLSQVMPKPEELKTYFTNNQPEFRIPEKLKLQFVRLPASNFFGEADQKLSTITNLAKILDQVYQERGTNSFKDKDGKILTPEAAKEQIKQDERIKLALDFAKKKAYPLSAELIESENKNPAEFGQKAAKYQLPLFHTQPFEKGKMPAEVPAADASAIADEAGRLSMDEPFSKPIVGKENVYVLGLEQMIPSSVPPFESVLPKVTESYKKFKSEELAKKAGRDFHGAVTNGLAQKKTFDAIAAEAKVKPVAVGPFSKSDRKIAGLPVTLQPEILGEAADNVPPGKAGEFTETADGGVVLFVKSRAPVNEETFKAEFPKYLDRIRSQNERFAYNEWINREYSTWLTSQPPAVQEHFRSPERE